MTVAGRSRRAWVVAVGLLATVAGAGCGSDEPTASTGSAGDFLDSLDNSCRSASKLIRKLDPADSNAVSDLADYLSNALDGMVIIHPPASAQANLDAFVARIEDQITELGRLDRAVRGGDDAGRRDAVVAINDLRDAADTAAIKLGAAKCVGLTPADGLAPPPPPETTTTTIAPETTMPATTAAPATTGAPTTIDTTVETTATTAAPETTVTTSAPVTTPPVATTAPPGPPRVVAVEATTVRPDSTDSCGRPTSYPATNVIDGRRDSAWMAPGDASGESLIFHLAVPSVISRVGLVPGYDKFDPCTDSDRFPELRRISAVQWTFDDGTVIDQELDADSPSMQYVQVPAGVTTLNITMRIVSTTEPGGIDHTPISEVSIL